MKRLIKICAALFAALPPAVRACAESAEQTTAELTDVLPETTGAVQDLTKTFLNINLYMFAGAVVLLAASTVVVVILKRKK